MNYFFRIVLAGALATALSCEPPKYPNALEPEQALKSFRLQDGFNIELFAAEPHAMDPVEMVFDELGNAFVVEMPDYPFKPDPGKQAGRIKVLQDTDNDGQIDKSIVFADSLSEATSVLPWKGGLLVTTAPYILYLKDTNNDFVADTREELFSGFFANNSEAQITSLRFGIDNWIYAANNGQAGQVGFSRKPDAPPLDMRNADFRFRLDRDEFELESGNAQFGHTLDDWGNRFITQNTIHIRQVVIPGRYLNRHPHLASKTSFINISDHDLEMFQDTPPPYWRAERTRRRQQQYKEQNLDRVEYAEDHFTGCSGGTFYDGDAFPQEYYGNIFTGDVAGNLVHRDVLVEPDTTPHLIARRHASERDREFLSSSDPWFRPAGFTVGPDGMLYIIDMYRQHIETPLSIPEDLKADMDFLAGSDRGRIYRITPANRTNTHSPVPNFREAPTEDLLKLLSHPGRWWRLQGQRLLVERQDASVIPQVTMLFTGNNNPRVRLHALYVLEALNGLNPGIIRKALADVHPGVRKHAIILSEKYAELLPDIIRLADDSVVVVAFQAALSIGQFPEKKAEAALARILSQHGAQSWFRTAVLSSNSGTSARCLELLMLKHSFTSDDAPWKASFLHELSYAIGSAGRREETGKLLNVMSSPSMNDKQIWQARAIEGLTKGLERSTPDAAMKEMIKKISTSSPDQTKDAIATLKNIFNSGSL